jgi:hypothetical protein
VGVALFQEPLAAILRGGFVNAVAPHVDRGLAFWFMILSPVCVGLGLITSHAVALADARLLGILGWTLLLLGAFGVLAIPVSGFWIFVVLSLPLLARSLRPPHALHG